MRNAENKITESVVEYHVAAARRIADLRDPRALARYTRLVRGRLGRGHDGPDALVPCTSCGRLDAVVGTDGALHYLTLGVVSLFEWLPFFDTIGRAVVCFDCAVEAFRLKEAGHSTLHLPALQLALCELSEARRREPNDDSLYEDGASQPHYEASIRELVARDPSDCRLHPVIGRGGSHNAR